MESTTLLLLATSLIALFVGAALAWLIASRTKAVLEERARLLQGQMEQARAAAAGAAAEAAAKARSLAATLEQRATRIGELEAELAAARASQAENERRLNTFIADTEKRFTDTFRSLASQILEEKTAKFTATNETKLNELLNPFRERLKDFQKKIEDNHLRETTERRSLKDELKRLMELNQQVSQDTKNLTTALKGEAKTQGTWGEIILERVLEMSGLTRDREYVVQDSRVSEDGSRQQPDVVIRLPPDRNLIVDSKVSLVAFERYSSADNDEDRAAALEQHLVSVRNHINGLSEKNYPSLYGLESLDFVLMFVPVEPAFLAAVQADTGLYDAAWRKNVVLVSPTTLMATARVVESVWRLERQSSNVMKIARQAGSMHDAFVAFVLELEKTVRQFQSASASLDSAMKKLHTGRGNLVRRAEDIRKLGAKAAKKLPAGLLEVTEDETVEDVDGVEPEADDETGLETEASTEADQSLRH
ncbi:MAG: DNA recombination protein RmuC [Gammaproteobacteria bacterium]|nr:DNA recombination protein RmuC [Gammaproteobacteria bacterium]